ncbi:hypothetical protein CXZ10_07905 [Pleomorphomonas diazotrophica]|uniref:Efflux RND transporter periplasmic adaptor subunit n=1 Tax=Pleomorphomonas diazotrophica TaxID=1166257 RepID=A0A1I4UUH8_9HYPH|nr:efflux RND transporter periplasmic adaptor subunit [Pleomorphomonas diazotrophica]PKR89812.1 hypothetical protein CXZ10_07905 [Pleomorphomonas diazotrophica]SFM92591.1 HlyD family secretion protein [Pleomorphomonas diazotrophica]
MRGRIGIAIVLIVVIVGGAVLAGLGHGETVTATDPPPSRTAVATIGDLQRVVTATGIVRPKTGAEIQVGAEVVGRLVAVPVTVGTYVDKGTVLARIDPATFAARREEADAALKLAEAERDYSRLDLGRKRYLLSTAVGSVQAVDTARTNLAAAEARLRGAAARLALAEIDLGRTTVTAPIAGYVADVAMTQGETLSMRLEMPSLVTIIDISRLEVRAFVDETDIGSIRLGQKATFTVDSFPDQALSASVVAIEPKPRIENGVVNYVVKLDFAPVPGVVVRPEMTAHVRLTVGAATGAILIPRAALRRNADGEAVRIRAGDGWVDKAVVTGLRDETMVEIRAGLAGGEIMEINDF